MKTRRQPINESAQDYFEIQLLRCTCGKEYESKRLVWDGKPATPHSTFCADCEVFSTCTPFTLPTNKKSKPHWDRVESTPTSVELAARIWPMYRDLCALAYNGDDLALSVLVQSAKAMTAVLQRIALCDSKRLIPMAQHDIVWPGLIGRKSAFEKTNQKIIKALKVGAKSPHNGPWHPDSPATTTAICIDHWLHCNQHKLNLPAFSSTTARNWFERGWTGLLFSTNGTPERNAYLRGIGKSAVGKKSVSRGMPAQTKGMRRDDVRAKIKENVWRSFCSINSIPL